MAPEPTGPATFIVVEEPTIKAPTTSPPAPRESWPLVERPRPPPWIIRDPATLVVQ